MWLLTLPSVWLRAACGCGAVTLVVLSMMRRTQNDGLNKRLGASPD